MKENPADISARENLEKQRGTWGKTESVLTVVLCALFILGMTFLFFVLPHKEYSKTENRVPASFPEFTAESFRKGEFNKGLVNYVKDRFPFRDALMGLNGLYDVSLGRLGSGGVILGRDGYLLYEERPADQSQKAQLSMYADVIKELAEKIDTVAAVAGKGSEIGVDRYPAVIDCSPIVENRSLINDTLSGGNYAYIDLAKALKEHANEEVYYKTDHHWTHLGAYYAVCEIEKVLGRQTRPLSDYTKETAMTDFKGTIYNRSGLYFLPGEELFYLRYDGDDGYTVRFCDGWGRETAVSHSLYDLSCLEEDYKGTAYDSFVAPVSTPVVRIEKEGDNRETLLILKDSFAHSALSFLARDYDLITFDIRTANYDCVLKLIEDGEVDKLLVLVNPATLFGNE